MQHEFMVKGEKKTNESQEEHKKESSQPRAKCVVCEGKEEEKKESN